MARRRRRSYVDQLCETFADQIDELEALTPPQKAYLRSRWLDQMSWAESKAAKAQARYYRLRIVTVVGAVMIPALVGLDGLGDPWQDVVRGATWTVSLEKEFFVGRDALAAEAARAPAWQVVGIEVEWDSLERLYADVGLPPRLPTAAWRMSVPVYDDGKQVGYATSGSWSPLLKKYIALAHVTSRYARPGTEVAMEVTVEHHRRRAAARVAQLPFFNPERKRA
jgi:hypothetical protein